MNIDTLNAEEIREIYHHRMVKDFPRNERKSLGRIQAALRRGAYRCLGLRDGGEILAYAFFVILNRDGRQDWLFDYFAVREDLRGTGIGSVCLQALSAGCLQSADSVLLEVDDPAAAEPGAERTIRERRQHFYLRNGLRETSVRAKVFGADYVLLELPVHSAHSPRAAAALYEDLYRSILPAPLYERMVRVTVGRGDQES